MLHNQWGCSPPQDPIFCRNKNRATALPGNGHVSVCGCIYAIVYIECDIYASREIAEVVGAVLVGTQGIFFLFYFFFAGKSGGKEN